MDVLDAVRRALFEQTFGLGESDAGAKTDFLRRIGVPEEHIAGLCRPGLHAGVTLGGAHPVDVQLVVEQVLFRQQAGAVTIRVTRDPHDPEHLRIEVVGIDPPAGQGGPNP